LAQNNKCVERNSQRASVERENFIEREREKSLGHEKKIKINKQRKFQLEKKLQPPTV
jgi:hypothetical protein